MYEWMDARTTDEIDSVVLHARLHARAGNFRATTQDRIGIRQRSNINLVQAF
jgi:hypothetical protein